MTTNIILGICAFTHDSSAALYCDGLLVGFLEEDRLVRRKHTSEFPDQAVSALLDAANVTCDMVNHVVYTFDRNEYRAGYDKAQQLAGDVPTRAKALEAYQRIIKQHDETIAYLHSRFPNATCHEVPHHIAHSMSGIVFSDTRRGGLLVVDSIGEAATCSVGCYSQTGESDLRVELKAVSTYTDSLGYIYGAITDHLGYKMRDEEGTVMALAALGDPCRYKQLLNETIQLRDSGAFSLSPRFVKPRVFGDQGKRLTDEFSRHVPRRAPFEALKPLHADLAASLQRRTEEAIVSLVSTIPYDYIVITGGVATNCVAIGVLSEQFPKKRFFVPPAPGDSGTSLGAAAFVNAQIEKASPSIGSSPFIGVEPEIPPATHPLISMFNPTELDDTALSHKVALMLSRGQVGGVFKGRAEAGPRALGNRSVLAAPGYPGVMERLAVSVKKREQFRPFAPAILERNANLYVEMARVDCSYMGAAVEAKPLLRRAHPEVVHDNSRVRIQTVPEQTFMGKVLDQYETVVDQHVLINTSLNSKGFPTVGHWKDAVDCLRNMDLDFLVLGNLLLTK